MAMIKVNPGQGRRVRDPATKTMEVIGPGYLVDDADPYWYRRLMAGDIVPADGGTWPPADPVTAEPEVAEAKTEEAPAKTSRRAGAPSTDQSE
jgi:hypothetical protein